MAIQGGLGGGFGPVATPIMGPGGGFKGAGGGGLAALLGMLGMDPGAGGQQAPMDTGGDGAGASGQPMSAPLGGPQQGTGMVPWTGGVPQPQVMPPTPQMHSMDTPQAPNQPMQGGLGGFLQHLQQGGQEGQGGPPNQPTATPQRGPGQGAGGQGGQGGGFMQMLMQMLGGGMGAQGRGAGGQRSTNTPSQGQQPQQPQQPQQALPPGIQGLLSGLGSNSRFYQPQQGGLQFGQPHTPNPFFTYGGRPGVPTPTAPTPGANQQQQIAGSNAGSPPPRADGLTLDAQGLGHDYNPGTSNGYNTSVGTNQQPFWLQPGQNGQEPTWQQGAPPTAPAPAGYYPWQQPAATPQPGAGMGAGLGPAAPNGFTPGQTFGGGNRRLQPQRALM